MLARALGEVMSSLGCPASSVHCFAWAPNAAGDEQCGQLRGPTCTHFATDGTPAAVSAKSM